VQSRIKELDKIERIEIPPKKRPSTSSFRSRSPERAHRGGVQGRGQELRREARVRGVNFVIERGDRVALVGVNGAGKSTLIKLLAGAEPLSAGEFTLGHNVEPDYFAQDQYKALDPGRAPAGRSGQRRARASATQTRLRSLLGCFLFSDDDVFKRIGVLSGGERNRYALARMLLHPPNFLLLDEPTNHLDLRAKDVLLERCRSLPARWCSSPTTAISSTSWPRAFFEIDLWQRERRARARIYPGNPALLRKIRGLPVAEQGVLQDSFTIDVTEDQTVPFFMVPQTKVTGTMKVGSMADVTYVFDNNGNKVAVTVTVK
jgi:ABC-type molybdenum transport system ATPase subunit/photorepair protein PhrA